MLTQTGTFRWSHKACDVYFDDDPSKTFVRKSAMYRECFAFPAPDKVYATYL